MGLRLRRAAFRSDKTLESFDFSFNPTLNRPQLFDLATGLVTAQQEIRKTEEEVFSKEPPKEPAPAPGEASSPSAFSK